MPCGQGMVRVRLGCSEFERVMMSIRVTENSLHLSLARSCADLITTHVITVIHQEEMNKGDSPSGFWEDLEHRKIVLYWSKYWTSRKS